MTDALVATLANQGYQSVFLPQTGVTPPDVYTYQAGSALALKPRARLIRHGSLSDYIREGSGSLTFVVQSLKSASIQGTHTSTKTGSGSVDFLSRALGCLGVPALPKIAGNLELGNALMFSFDDVTALRVDPSRIEQILDRIKLKGIPRTQIDRGEVHIVYEYLRARVLKMKRSDEGKFGTELSGKIGDWLNLGDAKIDLEVQGETLISFKTKKGTEPAAFAYRSAQLIQDGNSFSLNVHIVRAGHEGIEEPYVPHPTGPLAVDLANDGSAR